MVCMVGHMSRCKGYIECIESISLCVAVCGQCCGTGDLVPEESCRGGGFLRYHLRYARGDQL